MDAPNSLGGASVEKPKYIDTAERGQILQLSNILKPKTFLNGVLPSVHKDDASVYDFNKLYVGPEGRAFTVRAEGKIAGFVGVRKTTEDGLLIDQIRMGAEPVDMALLRALVEQVIEYAKHKGEHAITISLPDSVDCEHVFSHLGFHREKSEGEMRVLKWQH